METDLEKRLRAGLSEDAMRARLVNPDHPPLNPDRDPFGSGEDHTNRDRRWLVAVAAASVAIVAAGLVLIRDDSPQRVSIEPTSPGDALPQPTVADTAQSPNATVATPTPGVDPTSSDGTTVFVDLAGDAVAPLPAAPISSRIGPAAVWTGSEMVIWGGSTLLEPSGTAPLDDGAAFDLASGVWRPIAPAPIRAGSDAASVWTGNEMIVWGGSNSGESSSTGAAYDPSSDTWRTLPDAPIDPVARASTLWTGEEVIFLNGARPNDSGSLEPTAHAAAYNPSTDEWRRLAEPPGTAVSPYPQAVWTGEFILTILETPNFEIGQRIEPDTSMFDTVLARYDLSSDTWSILDDSTTAIALLDIPDTDPTTVLALSQSADTPIDVLDSAGEIIGELPGRPITLPGAVPLSTGVWVGDEALFWSGGSTGWAFNPTTESWRTFPAGDLTPRVDGVVLAAGDVLLAWGGYVLGPTITDADDGIIYRTPNADNPPANAGQAPPPVLEAPPVMDLLFPDADTSPSEPRTLDIEPLGWTLTFQSGSVAITDDGGAHVGTLNQNGPTNGSVLMGPIGEIPPPSGRWSIAIASTAPRLAVLPQPDEPTWTLTEPTTEVATGNGTLYIYIVDGGSWTDGYNTSAYPA